MKAKEYLSQAYRMDLEINTRDKAVSVLHELGRDQRGSALQPAVGADNAPAGTGGGGGDPGEDPGEGKRQQFSSH